MPQAFRTDLARFLLKAVFSGFTNYMCAVLRGGEVVSRQPHKLETAGAIPAPATVHICTTNQGRLMEDVLQQE